ncbi:hypothetical protein JCM15831A_03470 [Asaia astilbis]
MKIIFDANPYLGPHGDDGIEYSYVNGNLYLKIFYDSTKCIKLMFHHCTYQYFFPIPGHTPFKNTSVYVRGRSTSGIVYEVTDGDLMKGAREVCENLNLKFDQRQYHLYLIEANIVMDVISSGVTVEIN